MDNRRIQLAYKGNRCAYCGMSVLESLRRYDTFHRMYQFNHVDPDKKNPDYDNLIRRNISTEQLDELDKCVLLCNQCHGILHGQNIVTTMTIRVDVRGQTAEQTFKGQVIFDKVDNRLAFFTDDELLILPYWLILGDDSARLIFGKDLKDVLMSQWVPLTRERGPLVVLNEKREGLFGARRLDDEHVEIEHDCRFSLLPMQVDPPTKDQTIWFRNGLAIVRKGTEVAIHSSATCKGVLAYEALRKSA
ncbi:MAG TPA: hypothetical protein VK395_24170 [Gemmataceae bacterium]|nr:hypothetical protein [Gemmataceae bacterium]